MTLVDDCCFQVGVFLYVALVSMMTELQGKSLHSILLNTAGKNFLQIRMVVEEFTNKVIRVRVKRWQKPSLNPPQHCG